MGRSKEQIISDMVDAGMSDEEIRSSFKPKGAGPVLAEFVSGEKSQPITPQSVASATSEMLPLPHSTEGVKRLFSPRAGQFGPSRTLESAGQTVGKAVRGSVQNLADALARSKFGQKNPNTSATIGAVAGTAADVMSDYLTPSSLQQNIGAEGAGMVAERLLRSPAVVAARRHLGFRKGDLSSTKSGAEALRKQAEANRAAETMLDRGAISQTGNVETTASNVKKEIRRSGETLNRVLSDVQPGETGLVPAGQAPTRTRAHADAGDFIQELKSKLRPRFKNQREIVGQMTDDVMEMAEQNAPLSDIKSVLKERWGRTGYELRGVNTDASRLYRRGAAVLEKKIQKGVLDQGGRAALAEYIPANNTYGAAKNALKALGGELASQAGNNIISPVSIIAGGASGTAKKALEKIGLLEAMRRRGAGVAANVFGRANTGGIRAALSQAIGDRRRRYAQ